MSGICGITYKDKDMAVDNNMLTKMRDMLSHRGPDDAGNFINNNAGLGVRRLSITDIATGHQPMHNEDKTIWIVFNGEIYNHLALRESLEKQGHNFYTCSDTEAILHLYEQYKADCLSRLRGVFSFAIWDSHNRTLLLARDRLGIKPLYYAYKQGNLIFASEPKCILESKLVNRDIDSQALSCYFTYGYIPAPYSIFKDIRKLPAANFLLWREGMLEVRNWWDLDYRDKLDLPPDSICRRLEELIVEAVGLRLESDVPLGAFLSGGMDSSTIVSFMKDSSKNPIKTFSLGFDRKTHDELNYARIVSRRLDIENKKFVADVKTVDILPRLIWHLDEPFADTSIIPTYLLYKLTKEYVTVALAGDGGDEVFAGYSWVSRYNMVNCFNQFIPGFIRKPLYNLFIQNKSTFQYRSGRLNKLRRFILDTGLSLEECFLRQTTFDREIMDSILIDGNSGFDARDIQRSYFKQAKVKDIREKMLYADIKMYLPEAGLFKVDRMSMANSLEVRVPFLDHKLVEFAAKIPFELKLKGINTKYILKKVMAKRLPYKTIHKRKQGFSIPIDYWLREDLKTVAENILLSGKTKNRGLFNPQTVKKIIEQHQSGNYNLGYIIWALLIFEIWARVYLDSFSESPEKLSLNNLI